MVLINAAQDVRRKKPRSGEIFIAIRAFGFLLFRQIRNASRLYEHFVPMALSSHSFLARFNDRTILKERSAEDQLFSRSDESTTMDQRESRSDSERRRADFL